LQAKVRIVLNGVHSRRPGALVVTHAMLRRLTSWRCIIYYYYSTPLDLNDLSVKRRRVLGITEVSMGCRAETTVSATLAEFQHEKSLTSLIYGDQRFPDPRIPYRSTCGVMLGWRRTPVMATIAH